MCDVVTGAESSHEPLTTDDSLILHQPDYIRGSLSAYGLLRHTLDTDTGVGLGLGPRLVVTKLLASFRLSCCNGGRWVGSPEV